MKTGETTVTIPHDVADAIETLRMDSASDPAFDNEGIAHAYVTESYKGPLAQTLRKIPFDMLMRALLDGYERELTEEEARERACAGIRFIYAHHENEAHEEYSGGFCDGIEYVLDTLDIVIPGVNAPKETEVPANV